MSHCKVPPVEVKKKRGRKPLLWADFRQRLQSLPPGGSFYIEPGERAPCTHGRYRLMREYGEFAQRTAGDRTLVIRIS